MQEAFIQEKNAVGDWVQIGYSAPGQKTDNYNYTSNVIAYSSEEGASTWTAKPATNVTLNDCTADDGGWIFNAGLDANGTLAIEDGGSASDCTVLTASWDGLTKGAIQTH